MKRGVWMPALAAAFVAGCGTSRQAAHPSCPVRTGHGAYDTSLSPSTGPPGTTVTVSGPLPVVNEAGRDVGQTATTIDAYWNLDFAKWWSALGPSPLGSVAASPVQHLGKQDVTQLCRYRVRVEIPSVRPGTYPIEVLYGHSKNRASFAPADFRVTSG
jgi:hypothetical protein